MMINLIKKLCLLSLIMFLMINIFDTHAIAQESSLGTPAICSTLEQCQSQVKSYERDMDKALKALEEASSNNDVLYNKYLDYRASIYEREMAFHDIQVNAFKEQTTHGSFSLIVISVLMAAGLIFAGIQLWFGVKYGVKVESSENAIEMGNLSFKSSVMGITVLFIWLIAYFIYVEKIYPIDIVEVMGQVQQSSPPPTLQ